MGGGSSGPGNPGGGGVKKIMPSVGGGGVDFFWNNPLPVKCSSQNIDQEQTQAKGKLIWHFHISLSCLIDM